jgi:hypothetical protein
MGTLTDILNKARNVAGGNAGISANEQIPEQNQIQQPMMQQSNIVQTAPQVDSYNPYLDMVMQQQQQPIVQDKRERLFGDPNQGSATDLNAFLNQMDPNTVPIGFDDNTDGNIMTGFKAFGSDLTSQLANFGQGIANTASNLTEDFANSFFYDNKKITDQNSLNNSLINLASKLNNTKNRTNRIELAKDAKNNISSYIANASPEEKKAIMNEALQKDPSMLQKALEKQKDPLYANLPLEDIIAYDYETKRINQIKKKDLENSSKKNREIKQGLDQEYNFADNITKAVDKAIGRKRSRRVANLFKELGNSGTNIAEMWNDYSKNGELTKEYNSNVIDAFSKLNSKDLSELGGTVMAQIAGMGITMGGSGKLLNALSKKTAGKLAGGGTATRLTNKVATATGTVGGGYIAEKEDAKNSFNEAIKGKNLSDKEIEEADKVLNASALGDAVFDALLFPAKMAKGIDKGGKVSSLTKALTRNKVNTPTPKWLSLSGSTSVNGIVKGTGKYVVNNAKELTKYIARSAREIGWDTAKTASGSVLKNGVKISGEAFQEAMQEGAGTLTASAIRQAKEQGRDFKAIDVVTYFPEIIAGMTPEERERFNTEVGAGAIMGSGTKVAMNTATSKTIQEGIKTAKDIVGIDTGSEIEKSQDTITKIKKSEKYINKLNEKIAEIDEKINNLDTEDPKVLEDLKNQKRKKEEQIQIINEQVKDLKNKTEYSQYINDKKQERDQEIISEANRYNEAINRDINTKDDLEVFSKDYDLNDNEKKEINDEIYKKDVNTEHINNQIKKIDEQIQENEDLLSSANETEFVDELKIETLQKNIDDLNNQKVELQNKLEEVNNEYSKKITDTKNKIMVSRGETKLGSMQNIDTTQKQINRDIANEIKKLKATKDPNAKREIKQKIADLKNIKKIHKKIQKREKELNFELGPNRYATGLRNASNKAKQAVSNIGIAKRIENANKELLEQYKKEKDPKAKKAIAKKLKLKRKISKIANSVKGGIKDFSAVISKNADKVSIGSGIKQNIADNINNYIQNSAIDSMSEFQKDIAKLSNKSKVYIDLEKYLGLKPYSQIKKDIDEIEKQTIDKEIEDVQDQVDEQKNNLSILLDLGEKAKDELKDKLSLKPEEFINDFNPDDFSKETITFLANIEETIVEEENAEASMENIIDAVIDVINNQLKNFSEENISDDEIMGSDPYTIVEDNELLGSDASVTDFNSLSGNIKTTSLNKVTEEKIKANKALIVALEKLKDNNLTEEELEAVKKRLWYIGNQIIVLQKKKELVDSKDISDNSMTYFLWSVNNSIHGDRVKAEFFNSENYQNELDDTIETFNKAKKLIDSVADESIRKELKESYDTQPKIEVELVSQEEYNEFMADKKNQSTIQTDEKGDPLKFDLSMLESLSGGSKNSFTLGLFLKTINEVLNDKEQNRIRTGLNFINKNTSKIKTIKDLADLIYKVNNKFAKDQLDMIFTHMLKNKIKKNEVSAYYNAVNFKKYKQLFKKGKVVNTEEAGLTYKDIAENNLKLFISKNEYKKLIDELKTDLDLENDEIDKIQVIANKIESIKKSKATKPETKMKNLHKLNALNAMLKDEERKSKRLNNNIESEIIDKEYSWIEPQEGDQYILSKQFEIYDIAKEAKKQNFDVNQEIEWLKDELSKQKDDSNYMSNKRAYAMFERLKYLKLNNSQNVPKIESNFVKNYYKMVHDILGPKNFTSRKNVKAKDFDPIKSYSEPEKLPQYLQDIDDLIESSSDPLVDLEKLFYDELYQEYELSSDEKKQTQKIKYILYRMKNLFKTKQNDLIKEQGFITKKQKKYIEDIIKKSAKKKGIKVKLNEDLDIDKVTSIAKEYDKDLNFNQSHIQQINNDIAKINNEIQGSDNFEKLKELAYAKKKDLANLTESTLRYYIDEVQKQYDKIRYLNEVKSFMQNEIAKNKTDKTISKDENEILKMIEELC